MRSERIPYRVKDLKRVRKSVRSALLVAFMLLTSPCEADQITNRVDLSALAACGSGTTNGWIVSCVTNYSSANEAYKPNLRFRIMGSFVKSPDFGGDICRLAFDYRSSKATGRQLIVVDEGGDVLHTCDYSNLKSDGQFTNCVIEVTKPGVRRVTFKYNDGGSSTAWTLANLKIITTADFVSNLAVITNDVSVCLRWRNSQSVASNRVDVYRVKVTSVGSTNEVLRYDLSRLKSVNQNAECSDHVYTTFEGRLRGDKLYLLKDKPGTLRLSDDDNRGYLSIQCPEERTYSHLKLVLCRARTNDCDETSLSYVSEAETNIIALIKLTDTFKTNYIPLAAIEDKPVLYLNATGKKTDHCVLVTDIAFADIKEPQYAYTPVYTKTVCEEPTLEIRDLAPRSAHLFKLTTFTLDGAIIEAPPSEWFYPILPPGFMFLVH